VFDRMEAERNRILNRYMSEGEGEKANILGDMERALAQIRAETYKQDPDFFNFLKTLETYRETLTRKTTIVVPLDSKFFKYLTLEKDVEKREAKASPTNRAV